MFMFNNVNNKSGPVQLISLYNLQAPPSILGQKRSAPDELSRKMTSEEMGRLIPRKLQQILQIRRPRYPK